MGYTWVAVIISDDYYKTFSHVHEITATTRQEARQDAYEKYGEDAVVSIEGPFMKPDVVGYMVCWSDGTFSETYATWYDAEDARDALDPNGTIETVYGLN